MEEFKYTEIDQYYDKDYFDTPGKKSVYTDSSTIVSSEWHRQACGWFNSVVPVKDKKLLDAGCGVGHFMQGFENLGADSYGCDVSNFCADILIERNPNKFYHTCIEEMNMVPKSFFDIAYCGDVFEHIPAEFTERSLLNLISVCKPGGILYIAIDTTSYNHEGFQDISHINMQSWDEWLAEMDRPIYCWRHEFNLELKLREEKGFPGFPYDYWRFAVMRKN